MLSLKCCLLKVDRAQKAVQLAKDELDALIVLYRKQLGTQTLEFLTVSGSTHLIEVDYLFI